MNPPVVLVMGSGPAALSVLSALRPFTAEGADLLSLLWVSAATVGLSHRHGDCVAPTDGRLAVDVGGDGNCPLAGVCHHVIGRVVGIDRVKTHPAMNAVTMDDGTTLLVDVVVMAPHPFIDEDAPHADLPLVPLPAVRPWTPPQEVNRAALRLCVWNARLIEDQLLPFLEGDLVKREYRRALLRRSSALEGGSFSEDQKSHNPANNERSDSPSECESDASSEDDDICESRPTIVQVRCPVFNSDLLATLIGYRAPASLLYAAAFEARTTLDLADEDNTVMLMRSLRRVCLAHHRLNRPLTSIVLHGTTTKSITEVMMTFVYNSSTDEVITSALQSVEVKSVAASSGNSIVSAIGAHLKQNLAHRLVRLSLCNAGLSTSAVGVLTSLVHHRQVVELLLDDNDLHDGIPLMIEAAEGSLRTLSLRRTKCGPEHALASVLSTTLRMPSQSFGSIKTTGLRALFLDGNDFGDLMCKEIGLAMIESATATLVELSLNDNPAMTAAGLAFVCRCVAAVGVDAVMAQFSCGGCTPLGIREMPDVCAMMESCSTLAEFSLDILEDEVVGVEMLHRSLHAAHALSLTVNVVRGPPRCDTKTTQPAKARADEAVAAIAETSRQRRARAAAVVPPLATPFDTAASVAAAVMARAAKGSAVAEVVQIVVVDELAAMLFEELPQHQAFHEGEKELKKSLGAFGVPADAWGTWVHYIDVHSFDRWPFIDAIIDIRVPETQNSMFIHEECVVEEMPSYGPYVVNAVDTLPIFVTDARRVAHEIVRIVAPTYPLGGGEFLPTKSSLVDFVAVIAREPVEGRAAAFSALISNMPSAQRSLAGLATAINEVLQRAAERVENLAKSTATNAAEWEAFVQAKGHIPTVVSVTPPLRTGRLPTPSTVPMRWPGVGGVDGSVLSLADDLRRLARMGAFDW